jgi:hypothetical protein
MSRRAGYVRVEDIHDVAEDSQESDASSPMTQFSDDVLGSKVTRRLYNWNEIPAWQRDNEYILTGYRGSALTPLFMGCTNQLRIQGAGLVERVHEFRI